MIVAIYIPVDACSVFSLRMLYTIHILFMLLLVVNFCCVDRALYIKWKLVTLFDLTVKNLLCT